ncbi:cytidine deaminase-like protein [Viridothelium virens]|uniref:tRNA(adenine(34)) deaminase n=1 Tax=Viridothelium virens TaxID=1048519 RepID=A0A6A6HH11_VIRVR|nr:cytidine deaminase-like protein [Viridothelium virens]
MEAQIEDRAYHEGFMREAIKMAEQALNSDETPVGCAFVHDGTVIGRGMNETNKSLNGTRHCEFVALSSLLQNHPQSILRSSDLYVTVEPCIMCASALRQYHIRAVYFGCSNDRFGGTGGVLNIHSDPANIPPYKVYGGLYRDEAIMLLRRFYVQENDKAPNPAAKKGRLLKTDIPPLLKTDLPALEDLSASASPSPSPLTETEAEMEFETNVEGEVESMPMIGAEEDEDSGTVLAAPAAGRWTTCWPF